MKISDELRAKIADCVESAGVVSPEQVCDFAIEAAENCEPPEAAFAAALEVIQRALEADKRAESRATA